MNTTIPGAAALSLALAFTGSGRNALAESPDVPEVMRFDEVVMAPINLASSLIGAPVYTDKQELAGLVEDLIFRDDRTIVALKVGVGGFLGIDETAVALPLKDVTISSSDGRVEIDTDMSRDDLDLVAQSAK